MNIFKFEFKRLFKSAIIWSMVCSILVVVFMSVFPSMKEMGMQEMVGAKLDALPPALLEALNISGATDFTNISDYMAYALQYIGMAAGIYGSILGVSALVKEESEGTIEFLYSKPIKRSKIVTCKLLSAIVIFFMFIIIIGSTTMIVATLVKPSEVDTISMLMDIKQIFIGISFLGYIFMSVGFLISVLIKASKQAISIALSVYFVTYFIGIVGKLKESLEVLIYLSPMDYVVPSKLLKDGFELRYIIMGTAISILCIVGTYIIYNKKDLG